MDRNDRSPCSETGDHDRRDTHPNARERFGAYICEIDLEGYDESASEPSPASRVTVIDLEYRRPAPARSA